MKKIKMMINIIIVGILFILLVEKVDAKNVTLEEVKDTFNNSTFINTYSGYGIELLATIDNEEPNTLKVTITSGEEVKSVDFHLNGSILSNEPSEDFYSYISSLILADSIGKIHGYEYEQIINNFNMFPDEVAEYTVEEEGFEFIEAGEDFFFQMDITKKVPLIDESNFYLKPDTFDMIKDFIEEGTYGNQSGKVAKLVYDVSLGEDTNTIRIGEKDGTTISSYRSILSAIEVMYGKTAADYFEEKYPEFFDGYYEMNGFIIETDYDMDFEEEPMFEGTSVVYVEIDNAFMNDMFLREQFIGETVNRGNKTITLDFLENDLYKISYLESVSNSDLAFLIKYILEPVFDESGIVLPDDADAIYFNIENGKFVVGDKDNSVIKLILTEDEIELLPTKVYVAKTDASANHPNTNAKEWDECEYGHEHFRYAKYNVTVNITYGVGNEYEVLEGSNQVLNLTKGETLQFKFNIDYEQFLASGKVYVDNELVDASNYESSEGSTIITFKDSYVKSLTVKEHTIKVATNEGRAVTNFTLKNDGTSNPNTGDRILLYISLFIISSLGLIGMGIILRKNQFN